MDHRPRSDSKVDVPHKINYVSNSILPEFDHFFHIEQPPEFSTSNLSFDIVFTSAVIGQSRCSKDVCDYFVFVSMVGVKQGGGEDDVSVIGREIN